MSSSPPGAVGRTDATWPPLPGSLSHGSSARLSYSLPPRPPRCDSGSKSGEIKVSGHIGSTHLGLAEREMRGAALGRPPVEGHISQKSSDVCVYRGADRSTDSGGGE